MRWLLLLAIGCSAGIPEPCSTEYLAAQHSAIVAECQARKRVECKDYDVLDECPLAQECDSRIDRVGAGCP
jgi:hypothetical protein